jgi:hypothetical protein
MTLFTAYGFPATGASTNRTLPDRLSDIYNVKDYGATGAGFPTDDWAAITACLNHGEITLIAIGSNSGNTVTFASVPSAILNGAGIMWGYDVTTPSAITSGEDGKVSQDVPPTSTTVSFTHIAGTVHNGDHIRFRLKARGEIFFPPGNYYVSQPIDFYDGIGGNDLDVNNCACRFRGCLGQSIVTGNFADYVFSRFDDGTTRSNGLMAIENLTIINTHAAGGGIRMGVTQGASIRNCIITANKGINTNNVDHIVGGSWWGSFELEISSCILSPGSNVSGSEGLILDSDGPIFNNRIVGFETGIELFGGEGGMFIFGNYIANCGIGIAVGVGPGGTTVQSASSGQVLANWFKDNRVAITGMTSIFAGNRIEATDGHAPGGLNAQYGLQGIGTGFFAGNIITGNYDIAGISIADTLTVAQHSIFEAVQATNGSATVGAVPWAISFNAVQTMPQFTACNTQIVCPVIKLPSWNSTATGTWSAGTATISLASHGPSGSLNDYNGGLQVTITGMTPSGYNGTFTIPATDVTSFFQFTYPLVSNPGGAGSGGIAAVYGIVNNVATVQESDSYNVTDGTNGLGWGALITDTGTHTTHYKIRFDGTAFTVVGK